MLEIASERIILMHEIGKGNFSNVLQAKIVGLDDTSEAMLVAAKFNDSAASDEDRMMLYNEGKQMQRLKHVNVVRLVGVCFSATPSCLLLELMVNGDLRTYLRACSQADSEDKSRQSTSLTPAHLSKLAMDCACGVEYLASMKHVHRDLAARNVVLSAWFTAKIGDFGKIAACGRQM
jgi:serine/threonine protein kinase